jgi:integrase
VVANSYQQQSEGAEMARKITLEVVRNLRPGEIAWDGGKGAVSAFGARRQKGDAVAYVLKYRTKDGRQRWHTIGRQGSPWTPDQAREEARRILGEVADGGDPASAKAEARKAATVADLCDAYLEAAEAGKLLTRLRTAKKPSTLATDKGRIGRHIKPLLGWLKVAAVTQRDVERFRDSVADGETRARIKTGKHGLARVTGGQGTATRTTGLLGAIFAFAVKRGLRTDNPVRGVERHADGQRNRRLQDKEYAALGEALRTMPETAWPIAVGATKFLALTGWRRGEMLGLKWAEVDLATRTARLADTKTGASLRPLPRAACDVLRDLPQLGALVFPASVGPDKPMSGFHKVWLRIAKRALFRADVTPHVLRHSFASIAADLGFSELTIAALMGHKKASVTSKYAHHADAVLLQAADAVSDRIAKLLGDSQSAGAIIPLMRSRA